MNDFYVYGAWPKTEPHPTAANAVYIGKGSGDRLNEDHPNVPNYSTLRHEKFKDCTGMSEKAALDKEAELIKTYQPKYNDYLK
jgi:hypothetical protein